MENADKDLKDIEDALRALAAADRTPRAQDAALLARLVEKADCAYLRRSLRSWYRSPMLWRSVAALVLLAAIPFIWQSLHPVEERGGVAVAAPVKVARAATLEIASEPQAVVLVDNAPIPETAAMPACLAVQEPTPVPETVAHETAIAVYSGGQEAGCSLHEDAEEAVEAPATAIAVNSVCGTGADSWDRAMPATLTSSVPGPQAAPLRAAGKAKRAARPRSIAGKLKIYAAALKRAATAP